MNAKRGQPPKGERALRDGIKVRLTGRDRSRLNRLAERSGVGPATEARNYIIEAMEREEELLLPGEASKGGGKGA